MDLDVTAPERRISAVAAAVSARLPQDTDDLVELLTRGMTHSATTSAW